MRTMRVRAKFVASRRETMPNGTQMVSGKALAAGVGGKSATKHRWLAPCRSQNVDRDGHVARAGTSLTEVLMSLMIMSIGVVSVATLFPISAVRTLEANKQTNSKIASFTAEALKNVDPQIVHNPDGFYPWPPYPAGAGATDQTPSGSNAFLRKSYLVDPIGWQAFNEDPATPGTPLLPFPIIAPPPTGVAPRDWFGNSIFTLPAGSALAPLSRRYTGASLFPTPYPTTAAQWIDAKARAAALVAQPDNWKATGEGQFVAPIPATATTGITGVTLDGDTDLSSVNPAIGVVYRAVIYDVDGNHSEVRDSIRDGMTVSYSGTAWEVAWLNPLPARFNSPTAGALPNIGKVRIEVADQIYTWMLSVRMRSSGESVDVVVFFKRNFDPNNERVFDAEFRKYKLWQNAKNDYDDIPPGSLTLRVPGVAGADENGNGTNDDVAEIGYPGIYSIEQDVPNATVTIKVPSTAADDERPKLRRGNYVYDTKNGLWYRIRAVQNEQFGVGPGSNEDWVDVVLDETIRLNSTEDLDGSGSLNLPGEDSNGNGVIDRGGVIVHPNVVKVLPLQ